jgi:hypothetical protein
MSEEVEMEHWWQRFFGDGPPNTSLPSSPPAATSAPTSAPKGTWEHVVGNRDGWGWGSFIFSKSPKAWAEYIKRNNLQPIGNSDLEIYTDCQSKSQSSRISFMDCQWQISNFVIYTDHQSWTQTSRFLQTTNYQTQPLKYTQAVKVKGKLQDFNRPPMGNADLEIYTDH